MKGSVPNQFLPSVREHLYAQDQALREKAAKSLSRTGSRRIVAQLLGSLEDQDRYVAIRAAWGLSLMKPALVIPYLARALNGRAPAAVVKQASWAMGRMNISKARRVLIAALKHPRRLIRVQAAGALWRTALDGFRNRRVEKTLIGLLKGDRGHVALTLSHMLRSRTRTTRVRTGRQHRGSTANVFQRMGGSFIR